MTRLPRPAGRRLRRWPWIAATRWTGSGCGTGARGTGAQGQPHRAG